MIRVEVPRDAVRAAAEKQRVKLAKNLRKGLEQAAREALLNPLREDTRAALKGPRIATTWQLRLYPDPPNNTLRPAAMVFTKAPIIIAAHEDGVTIKPTGGKRFLAIPTQNVPMRGRKRATMADLARTHGPWRIVPAKNGTRVVLGRKKGRAASRRKRDRLAAEAETKAYAAAGEMVAYFVLVPQVTLKKRLNVRAILAAGRLRFASLIQAAVNRAYND